MASGGGSREIEAARQRLAAAKNHASLASKTWESAEETKQSARTMMEMETAKKMMETANNMMETATKTSETAQSQLQRSRQEIMVADVFLMDAERRWDVIVIDVESESQGNERCKKRKVSMSPATGRISDNFNVDINGATFLSDTVRQSSNISAVNQAAVQQTGRVIQAESGEETRQAWAMFGSRCKILYEVGPQFLPLYFSGLWMLTLNES